MIEKIKKGPQFFEKKSRNELLQKLFNKKIESERHSQKDLDEQSQSTNIIQNQPNSSIIGDDSILSQQCFTPSNQNNLIFSNSVKKQNTDHASQVKQKEEKDFNFSREIYGDNQSIFELKKIARKSQMHLNQKKNSVLSVEKLQKIDILQQPIQQDLQKIDKNSEKSDSGSKKRETVLSQFKFLDNPLNMKMNKIVKKKHMYIQNKEDILKYLPDDYQDVTEQLEEEISKNEQEQFNTTFRKSDSLLQLQKNDQPDQSVENKIQSIVVDKQKFRKEQKDIFSRIAPDNGIDQEYLRTKENYLKNNMGHLEYRLAKLSEHTSNMLKAKKHRKQVLQQVKSESPKSKVYMEMLSKLNQKKQNLINQNSPTSIQENNIQDITIKKYEIIKPPNFTNNKMIIMEFEKVNQFLKDIRPKTPIQFEYKERLKDFYINDKIQELQYHDLIVQQTNQKMNQMQQIYNIENVINAISSQTYNIEEYNMLQSICKKYQTIKSLKNPQKLLLSQMIQQIFLNYVIIEQQNESTEKVNQEHQNQIINVTQVLDACNDILSFKPHHDVKTEEQKRYSDQQIHYVQFLNGGKKRNKLFEQIVKAFEMLFRDDKLSKFNSKSLILANSIIEDFLQKIEFQEICSTQTEVKQKHIFQILNFTKQNKIDMSKMDQAQKQWVLNLKRKELQIELQSYFEDNIGGQCLPEQIYYNYCSQGNQVHLPIFQKIFDGKLILIDYQISDGLSIALQQGMKIDPNILKFIYIENCGVDDKICSQILQGATNLKQLYSFAIKGQRIGLQSFKVLEIFLRKSYPLQLRELKLIKCQILQQDFDYLLDSLIKNSYIQNLVLMKMSFNQNSINKLAKFISQNSSLKNIDLSFNELTPFQYKPILQSLSENSNLQEIILSHNQLYNEQICREQDDQIQFQEDVLDQLQKIVQNNQSLQHLFLNQCGLSYKIILYMIPQIKHHPSLQAVHLSNNPGINQQNQRLFSYILDIKIHQDTKKMDYKYQIEDTSTQIYKVQNLNINLKKNDLELLQARRLIKEQRITNSYVMSQDPYLDKIFLLQRVIGYDEQLLVPHLQNKLIHKPSSWSIITTRQKKCWICEKHIYSLLIWNERIGQIKSLNVQNSDLFMKNIIRLPYETNRPVIYSSKNNWTGYEMHTLSEYCFILDSPTNQTFLSKYSYEQIRDYEFLKSSSKNFDRQLHQLLISYKRTEKFRQILDFKLGFSDPQIINGQINCISTINNNSNITTFILPQFLKPGRYPYIIEYPKGNFYFHQAIIYYRSEPIPTRFLTNQVDDEYQELKEQLYKENQKAEEEEPLQFRKSESLFSQWHEDTLDKISECISLDFKLMEIHDKINKKDIKFVENYIEKNYAQFKHLHNVILSFSNQPYGVDYDTLLKFVKKQFKFKVKEELVKSIYDDIIQTSIMNQESNKIKLNKDKMLCRFQLIEFFVYICQALNPQKKLSDTFELFLQKNVFASLVSLESIEEFRKNKLWTLEINNLLSLNILYINQVLDMYSVTVKSMGGKKLLSFESLQQIFLKDMDPPIITNNHELVKAVVFSKMTVVKDFEIHSNSKYFIQDCEFFEILGRIVEQKCNDTDFKFNPLYQKIENVLDQLVRIASPEIKSVKLMQNQVKLAMKKVKDKIKKKIEKIFYRYQTKMIEEQYDPEQNQNIESYIDL